MKCFEGSICLYLEGDLWEEDKTCYDSLSVLLCKERNGYNSLRQQGSVGCVFHRTSTLALAKPLSQLSPWPCNESIRLRAQLKPLHSWPQMVK
jgi:hypothetical protein